MAELKVSRHGQKLIFMYDTIKQAAKAAASDVETNEALPLEITEGGTVFWENTGPVNGSYDELRRLAGINIE